MNVPESQNGRNNCTDTNFYYFDINLFLIDDAWCKLCNIWLLLCEISSRSITIPQFNTGGKHCYVAVVTEGRMIDDNWKKQTKNQPANLNSSIS